MKIVGTEAAEVERALVATTAGHPAYNVAWGRRFADATDLVPDDYAGTIARDGYVVYRNYTDATHQTCTAHLLRRCVELIEADHPQGQATPRQVKTLRTEALAARERPEAERASKPNGSGPGSMRSSPGPSIATGPAAREAPRQRASRPAQLPRQHPKVDATNWQAEQAIRPAVVNRKAFGGNRTEHGAAAQSRMMTYFRTAVQQGIDPIASLVALARAPDRHTIGGLT